MKRKVMASSIRTATVMLESVDHRDAGNITCMADNGVGEVAEETATLNILGKCLHKISFLYYTFYLFQDLHPLYSPNQLMTVPSSWSAHHNPLHKPR